MASYTAVGVAALLQIILRTSFFIEQSSDMCSAAPTLASWIFLISFLDVLLDVCIYPVRYMHLPKICQVAVETIVTVFLTEFGTLKVWCTIEKISCKLSKALLLLIGMTPDFYYNWENYILGTVTTVTSLIILFFVGQATDHFYFMRKRSLRICGKMNAKFLETWTKLRALVVKNYFTNCEGLTNCRGVECFDQNSKIIYHTRRSNNKANCNGRRPSRSRSRKRR